MGEALVAATCKLANAVVTAAVAPLRFTTVAAALMNWVTLPCVFNSVM